MTGICTYTIYVHEKEQDGGADRPVPCGKPRVGVAQGPGLRVVVCKRHYATILGAMTKGQGPAGLTLTPDEQPAGEMAAAGGDD